MVGVLERSCATLAHLRAHGRLYEPLEEAGSVPPLADAPPPRVGRFSRDAEDALGEAGLWGLFVPPANGGTGATVAELARAITMLAADCPTAAGMLAVHSAIGAVSALVAFGTPEQQARHLPALAAGRPLSIFGGTEPDAGCDLGAIRASLTRDGDRLRLTGTKMFITGATHGRLVKVLANLDGRPAVVLARLPDRDTPTFRLRTYEIHPLKHAHNAALEFEGFEIDTTDLLAAGAGREGMAIVWHGLNRGRVTLAAQAGGTLRLMLAHAVAHAGRRHTWGRAIASRQLVQGRLARIAAAIEACDAVALWAAAVIDSGAAGELEAIVAKTVASGCVRDAALDALGVHGGRAFLVGHPLGDSLHDHLAVGIYEGESDLL
ncbi:MAG: acyl-CoA dehydrogenase, partial [Planctomycetia bacterium]|nr:acyl-CoA dehydrogenase [Planctomycetia bacterium]